MLNVSASLGLSVKALTRFVKGSPIARYIQGELRRRNIAYEGPEIEPDGPWGVRHQFNIADAGYGPRGPRVYNDRAGEVGRTVCAEDFDLDRIFRGGGRRNCPPVGSVCSDVALDGPCLSETDRDRA